MSSKDAQPITPEQKRMESFYRSLLTPRGTVVGWGRDRRGIYHAEYARDAWAAWQAAQNAPQR